MHILTRASLLLILVSVCSSANADDVKPDEVSEQPAEAEVTALPPAYPQWPQQPSYVNAVPAPPLGPYMSTGLQEIVRGFGCCQPAVDAEVAAESLENRPWPHRQRPPRRWEPVDGEYSYAPAREGDGIASDSRPVRPYNYPWMPPGGYR